MHSKSDSACAGILGSKARAGRQLADALAAVAELREYRKLLIEVQQMSSEARAACHGLAAAIVDRAFVAEASGRVLCKHALDALNELRDEGQLYDAFGNAARDMSRDGSKGLLEKLRRGAVPASEPVRDLMGEAASLVDTWGLELSMEHDVCVVHRRKGSEGPAGPLRLATTRQLGQMGRVTSDELFGGRNGTAFVTPASLYAPPDCHHRPIRARSETAAEVDVYGAAVGGLASAKGLLYQHARRVAELGPRGLRGEDPVTALIVGAIAVGAALTVYGLSEHDSGYFFVGAVLLGVGGAAAGAWTFVLLVAA